MTSILIHTRLWLCLGLIALLVACGGAGKPTIKLSATPTSLEDGQEVTLSAEAKGAQKVEFYRGTNKLGEDSSAPYELKLTVTSDYDATVSFTAKAIAANSQSAVSQGVSVSVKIDKEAPKISLSASNSNLSAAGAVTLTADATDNKGVVKVEFLKGTEKLGEDTTPADGFSLVVNLGAEHNGSLKYIAKAYDKKGNVGTSAEVTVSVDIDVVAPTISLNSDKTRITVDGSATLTADASDNKGVTKVEFFKGSEKIGEDTEAPFTFEIDFTADDNGTHIYSAKAFDAKDNSTSSNTISITIDIDKTLPTISLSANPTSLSAKGTLTLSATATDTRGVSKVEFYKNGSKIAEDTTGENNVFAHQVNYNNSHKDTDKFSAKAYDVDGNMAVSNTVEVDIDIDIDPPLVSLTAPSDKLIAPGSITLTATNSDNVEVSKLEFYRVKAAGDELLSPVINNPVASQQYTLALGAADNGGVKFYAKAFDAKGNTATSSQAEAKVEIKPSITIFEAAQGSSLSVSDTGGTVDLTWSGEHVESYTLEVSPEGATASINAGSHTGKVAVPANLTSQAKNYTVTLKAKAFGNIGIPDDVKTLTITVAKESTLPTVSLTKDPSTTIAAAGPVKLTAAVSDATGIQKVEFFKSGNSNPIGSDATSPYEYTTPTFTAADNGPHTYTARATDNSGNVGTSAEATITVDIDIIPPAISLGSNTTNLTQSGPALLTATVSDNKGVGKVEFYKGNDKIAEDLEAPFTHEVTFNATHNGPHTYTAKAFDTSGNSTPSGSVTITVDIDVTLPSVELKSSSMEVTAPTAITLTANATDNKGVVKVEFYKAHNKIAEDTTSADGFSMVVNYNQSLKGIESFAAIAYDADGNMGISNTVEIRIDIDINPPSVSLTAPPGKLTAPGTLTLTATSSDNFGVSKLEFYWVKATGDELLSPVINNPAASQQYPVTLGVQDNGIIKFYAKAFDAKGNVTTSTPQTEVQVEIKPTITTFGAAQGGSLNLSDAGGTVDVIWTGQNVQSYTLEVSPNDATVSINAGNASGKVVVPANLTSQPKTYTVTLKAKAYGNIGIADDVKTLTITVAKETTLPTISLSKEPTTTITAAGSVKFTATASDATGIVKVEFFKSGNATPISTDTESPYEHTVSYTGTDNGPHTYTARATDNSGNTKDSAPISVSVDIKGSLTVTISGLPAGTTGSVAVTGPDGFSQTLTATTTLSNLKAGTYTLTPASVDGGDYSYAATGSTVTVAGGSTANGTVAYTANTGALSVAIYGIWVGRVAITGPDGFSQTMTITAAATLTNLKPGTYTLTPENVDAGPFSYTATASSVAVSAGSTASGSVSYIANTGALNLYIAGFPNGVTPSVVVTGPGNFSQTFSASTILSKLAPGDYTLTPASVDSGNYSFAAPSSTVAITAGNMVGGNVNYAINTGAIAVIIDGLAGGLTPNVVVTGPGNFSQTVSASTALKKLAPGTYTITPANVDPNNYNYSAPTFTVDVTIGNTANGTFTYTAAAGALALTISGLPGGTPGSVVVTGPGNFSQTLTATTTLTKLAPGTYTLTPATLDSGNYSYAASSATVQVSVGNTAASMVGYALNTGALSVTISNLPAGQSVTVTGPGSYSRTLTTTTTLPRLAPGSYTITAPDVTSYAKTITGSPAALTSGNTPTASVVYTLMPPGSLDTSFGTGGKAITPIGSNSDYSSAMALQPDGKIVVAGAVYGSSNGFGLARYNSNGTLDTAFGTNGTVITALGGIIAEANAVAIQPDGMIVAAGFNYNGNNNDFALVRYTSSGQLDTGFDQDGKVTTDFNSSANKIYALAIQADGKIVAAGSYVDAAGDYFALARYNSDGSLDTTFGTGGKVITDIYTQDLATAIAIQGNKIIVAGTSINTQASFTHDFALVRYNSNGLLDTTFGNGGKVTTDFGNREEVSAIALQSNGQIVVAGISDIGGTRDFALARYNSGGSLDTSFGTGGKVTTDFNAKLDILTGIAIHPDGNIVTSGYTQVDPINNIYDIALARYNSNGSLDSTFGTGGRVTTNLNPTGNSNEWAAAIAIQPDNKIVVLGSTSIGGTYDFVVLRYNP